MKRIAWGPVLVRTPIVGLLIVVALWIGFAWGRAAADADLAFVMGMPVGARKMLPRHHAIVIKRSNFLLLFETFPDEPTLRQSRMFNQTLDAPPPGSPPPPTPEGPPAREEKPR